MGAEGLDGVLTAGRREPAARRDEWADEALVAAQDTDERANRNILPSGGGVIGGAIDIR